MTDAEKKQVMQATARLRGSRRFKRIGGFEKGRGATVDYIEITRDGRSFSVYPDGTRSGHRINIQTAEELVHDGNWIEL